MIVTSKRLWIKMFRRTVVHLEMRGGGKLLNVAALHETISQIFGDDLTRAHET